MNKPWKHKCCNCSKKRVKIAFKNIWMTKKRNPFFVAKAMIQVQATSMPMQKKKRSDLLRLPNSRRKWNIKSDVKKATRVWVF